MVKKILKITVLVLAIVFVVIQFIRPNFNNPPENQADTLEASMSVPENVGMVLSRSCADCHSNRTIYPWYSKVSPASWYLDDHIRDGRRELNISEWNTYEKKKKIRKLDEICEQVEQGEMPLPSYLWIHWDAAMKPGEAQSICDWANSEKDRLQSSSE
jgi:hypothetical protein